MEYRRRLTLIALSLLGQLGEVDGFFDTHFGGRRGRTILEGNELAHVAIAVFVDRLRNHIMFDVNRSKFGGKVGVGRGLWHAQCQLFDAVSQV